MAEGAESFNPYEPPQASIAPAPRAGSVVRRPRWVSLALGGSKLPGVSARRSARIWWGFAVLVGSLGLVGGVVFGLTHSLRVGLTFGGMAGGTELAASEWLRRAIEWVDRHDAW